MLNQTFTQVPANKNLEFVAGDDFPFNITISDNDVADTFEAAILNSNGVKIVDFTCTPMTGGVSLLLTDAETILIPAGFYTWYLKRDHEGVVRTLISGKVMVSSNE